MPRDDLSERFRIISPLGAGGFGDAFRAWDTTTGVPVVLKRPLARHIGNRLVLERFDREIRRLMDLFHPHIVPIVDHGHNADGLPFLAMRFLPGGSLEDRPRPSPVNHLRRWLPGVAAALDHLHARGVLHRDVKPGNIFFDTRLVPFLGDFGIAKIIDEELAEQEEDTLTKTGGAIGTHPYMAPEFFRKPRVLSGAYDQYALAVTVFEMVAGKRPFRGDAGQLVLAHAIEKPPSLSALTENVPGSLAAAVSRALAKDPAKRFPSCLAFAEAALTDLPPIRAAGELHQFLCPGCRRLVRVPADFHGRSCKCPYCEEKLRVAANLDALWRHDEDPTTTRSRGSTGPAEPPRVASNESARSGESRSRRRLLESFFILGLPISASVILGVSVLAMLMPSLFHDAVALFLGPSREAAEVASTPVPVVAGTAKERPREPPPQPLTPTPSERPDRPAAAASRALGAADAGVLKDDFSSPMLDSRWSAYGVPRIDAASGRVIFLDGDTYIIDKSRRSRAKPGEIEMTIRLAERDPRVNRGGCFRAFLFSSPPGSYGYTNGAYQVCWFANGELKINWLSGGIDQETVFAYCPFDAERDYVFSIHYTAESISVSVNGIEQLRSAARGGNIEGFMHYGFWGAGAIDCFYMKTGE